MPKLCLLETPRCTNLKYWYFAIGGHSVYHAVIDLEVCNHLFNSHYLITHGELSTLNIRVNFYRNLTTMHIPLQDSLKEYINSLLGVDSNKGRAVDLNGLSEGDGYHHFFHRQLNIQSCVLIDSSLEANIDCSIHLSNRWEICPGQLVSVGQSK